MNKDILLDRQYFNINTRGTQQLNNDKKKVEGKKYQVPFLDRSQFDNDFKKNNKEEKEISKIKILNNQEDKYKKINNIRFNDYQVKYKNDINVDRIGYDNNKKEQIYYSPYKRNISIKKKNDINGLDFIDKNQKTEYYKKLDLKKFNPNINYKDFL